MRKKNIIIVCVLTLILALCTWFFTRKGESNDTWPPEQVFEQMDPVTRQKMKEVRDRGGKPSDFFKAEIMTPITFYGKVVDQNEEPIPGADVTLSPNDSPVKPSDNVHLKSDENGLFSVTGLHGISLGVDVEKQGYYKPRSLNGKTGWTAMFGYAVPHGGGLHQPRKDAPVVFHLYKPTQTEPLIHTSKNVRIPKDGTPVVFDLGKSENGESLKVQCRSWVNDKEKDESRHYDWRFEIKVLDGGLLERKDNFQFVAPESGYQESDGCDMTKNMELGKTWRARFGRDYFLKFNNGIHGRVYVALGSGWENWFDLVSEINPKNGSRSLEAEPREH